MQVICSKSENTIFGEKIDYVKNTCIYSQSFHDYMLNISEPAVNAGKSDSGCWERKWRKFQSGIQIILALSGEKYEVVL